jgi:hypothetical protein
MPSPTDHCTLLFTITLTKGASIGDEGLEGGRGGWLALCNKLCKNAGSKPICGAKWACVDFLSSDFNFQGHTWSTGGVASTWSSARSSPQEFPI